MKVKEIKKGDTVKIKVGYKALEGIVLTAAHYGKNGWYIELKDKNTGYEYYKECYDGGRVVEVNGQVY